MKSGIYSITNTVNGKVYIGSSADVDNRWSQHTKELRGNRHKNRHLQFAWNKYGESAFKFELIKEVPVEQLLDVEQSFLDTLDYSLAYNLSHDAYSVMGGRKHTEETKDKLRGPNNVRYGKPGTMLGKHLTDKQRKKVSLSLVGTKRHLDKNTYQFRHRITNEVFNGTRQDFYTQFNLKPVGVWKLLHGVKPSYKEWVLNES
jgi:group I intron endonuclease